MKFGVKTTISFLALAAASQIAHSHPSLGSSTLTAGTNVYNSVNISHGCTHFDPPKPIKGTVGFFPDGTNPTATAPNRVSTKRADGTSSIVVQNVVSVRQVIGTDLTVQGTPTTIPAEMITAKPASTNTALQSLAGLFRPVQNAAWKHNGAIKNAAGSVIGYWSYGGELDTALYGQTVFRASAGSIWFKPDSCAKAIAIRVPAVDTCKIDRKKVTEGYTNSWINNQTPNIFTDKTGHGIGIDVTDHVTGLTTSDNFWMTLTINRNTTDNPIPSSCAAASQYTVVVTPSYDDLENYLKIPGFYLDKAK
mgnify:CR=1 FL=1